MIWWSIFSLILTTLNWCLNTQLVHDVYLKSMEGHFLVVNYWEILMQIIFFVINNIASSGCIGLVPRLFPSLSVLTTKKCWFIDLWFMCVSNLLCVWFVWIYLIFWTLWSLTWLMGRLKDLASTNSYLSVWIKELASSNMNDRSWA